MATYEMKFMFDWLSGTCVWSVNAAAHERYDYPVDLSSFPYLQTCSSVFRTLSHGTMKP